jgi:hypothetical protein
LKVKAHPEREKKTSGGGDQADIRRRKKRG